MEGVLTLVAGGPAPALDEALAAARSAVAAAGAAAGEAAWLAAARAVDLPFSGDPVAVEGAAREALAAHPVDLAAQPRAGRRKRLLLADMDSTIVESETLDDLAAFAGLRERIAAITARAMNGELDFAAALRERVAMLQGLPASAIDSVLAEVRVTAGARTLVATMRRHGAYTALVSGGFSVVTGAIRERVGFDVDRSNELLIEDGRLAGRVREPILDRHAKLATLTELAGAHGLALADCATVGDGANDLPMLLAAGLGVAFRAKPVVAASARFRVDHADLTALLYFQGYRQDQLVESA